MKTYLKRNSSKPRKEDTVLCSQAVVNVAEADVRNNLQRSSETHQRSLVITGRSPAYCGPQHRDLVVVPGRLSLLPSEKRQNEYQPKGGDALRLGTKGRHGVICR